MRILFMGTPDFAAVSLRYLVEAGHEICAVFTQPDKPKNRGHKIIFSPVKSYALSVNLPVEQPPRMRNENAIKQIQVYHPELIVVAAYGQILPEEVLHIPQYGAINVHSSLLPKYRGAAPINWAILNDEQETGISIMYMTRQLDAGDIILQKKTAIEEYEDALSLTKRLAILGAEALLEAVQAIESGRAHRIPQEENQVTYAPLLSRELSPVDWTKTAREISCQIRGLIPWPCAATNAIRGEEIKLYAARVLQDAPDLSNSTPIQPGTIIAAGKNGIDFLCGGNTVLRVTELQARGGKRMSAAAYLLGHPV